MPHFFLITGEPYQAGQSLNEYKASFISQGYEYYSFDISDNQDISPITLLLASQGLFNKAKCVMVRVQKAETIRALFEQHQENIGDNVLIFFAPGQRALKISHKLLKNTHVEVPEGMALRTFIEQALIARQIKPSPSIISLFATFPVKKNGMGALVNEIEKFSLAPTQYPELRIMEGEENPFAITDALSKRNPARALALLEKELTGNQKAVDVLNRILWQLRVLLLVASVPARTPLSFHPFVIKKAREAIGFFSLSELTQLYLKAILLYERLLFSGLPSQILLSQFFWEL